MDTHKTDTELKPLSGVPFEMISEAFLEAFADYGMDLDAVKLRDMLTRRGARPDLSFAAFADGRIVSFIINGIGEYNGSLAAYDTGTGTIPEYRGLGLTDRIFNYSVGFLRNAGVRTYLLEVLKDNIPAVRIYSRQGFEVSREFDCYTSDIQSVADRLSGVSSGGVLIREVTADAVAGSGRFMDFIPSWQNSVDSLARNPDAFTCLAAYRDNEPVGFGVSETAYGDISLIAVDKGYRRQGIGSVLLNSLVRRSATDRVKVLNVDSRSDGMASFLAKAGFGISCRQYEMIKTI